jgi:hypothetical protein
MGLSSLSRVWNGVWGTSCGLMDPLSKKHLVLLSGIAICCGTVGFGVLGVGTKGGF